MLITTVISMSINQIFFMSIIDFNKFFINKKYHMKKLFTLLIALCSFMSWSFGQYSNDFSGGSVSGNTYIGTPMIDPNLFSTEWSVTTGATMSNSGGTLLITPLPNSGFATLKLTLKVKCGYRLRVNGVSFKHSRNIDGPSTAGLKVNSTTIATINPVPTGVLSSFTSPAFTDNTWGETNIYLDLSGIGAPASGSYEIDDFVVTGTVVPRTSLTDPNNITDCAGVSATFVTGETIGGNLNPAQLVNPVFHWQKNVTDIPFLGGSYTINPIAAADAGNYRAYVTYDICNTVGTNTAAAAGVFTNSATLVVKPKPTISGVSSTPSVICSGGQTGFSATGLLPNVSTIFNYTVNGNPGSHTAMTDANGGVSFPAAAYGVGTYNIVIVSATVNGCTTMFSANNTTSFTVNPLPTPTIAITETSSLSNDDGTICNGATISLTASGGTGYVWSTTATTAVITPSNTATATYTVTVTDANSCTAVTSQLVTVNPNPTPSVAIAETSGTTPNDGIVCAGASITLTASGGTSYSWDNSVSNGVAFTPISTTYSVTVTNANSCTATTTQAVTVNPLPIITFTGNGTPSQFQICSGAPITISTGGYSTFTWSVTNGSGDVTHSIGSSNSTSIVVTPTSTLTGSTGTMTVSYTATDGNGCTTSNSVVVTVNPSPSSGTLSAMYPGLQTSLCEGGGTQIVNLSATPSGGIGSLQNIWSSAPMSVLSLAPSGVTAVGTSGVSTATGPNAFTNASVDYRVRDQTTGCFSPNVSVTVSVYTMPSTANAGLDEALCNTESFTLAGNAPSVGAGTWSYVSGGSVTITTPSSPTSTITGLAAGASVTLRWTISNGPCTTAFDEVTLTNNAPVMANAGPDQALCNTGSFTLAGNTPISGVTGLWTIIGAANGASITNATSPNATIAGLTAGQSVTLRWTVTNGAPTSCIASDDVVLTNNAPPSPAIISNNPSIEACNANVFTVNADPIGAGSMGDWSLSPSLMSPQGVQSPNAPTTSIVVPQPTLNNLDTYTATWTVSAPGCPDNVASVLLKNYHTPTVSNAGLDQANCSTVAFTLAGNVPSFGTGVWTLVGSATNGTLTGLPSGSNNASVNLSLNTGFANSTATLQWTISNGVCPASTDQMILQNDASVTASISPVSNQCGLSVFNVTGNTPTYGSGQWVITGGSITTGTSGTPSVSITANAPDAPVNATWTVTNGACSSNSSVTFEYDAPTTSSITPVLDQCNNLVFPVTASSTGGTGVWTVTGGTITTGTTGSPSISITANAHDADVTATWTVTNGLCSSFATEVFQSDASPTANAGADVTTCAQTTPFTLNASLTPASANGVWTVTGGSVANSTSASTTATVAIGSTGTFTWTVTNGTCINSSSDVVVIKNNNPISITLTPSPFPKMCPSGSSITLTPTITGGTGNYTTLFYSSNNLKTTLTPLNNAGVQATIAPGATAGSDVITFSVTDNATCTAVTTFNAVVVDPLTASVNPSGIVDVCVGSNTTLTANAGGGSALANLTYLWSVTNGPGTASIVGSNTSSSVQVTGNTAGTVVVSYTVTDTQTGCSTSTSKTITVRSLTATAVVTSNYNGVQISCNGASNGIISVTPAGNGVTPLVYTITIGTTINTTGASSGVFTGLAAGNYVFTVADINGCSTTAAVNLSEPAVLVASLNNKSNVTCSGGNNGSITATTTGGTGVKTITAISPSVGSFSGLTASGLTAGSYMITVTDANGCTSTFNETISQPAALTLSSTVTILPTGSQISCPTSTDGTITVSAGGGTIGLGYAYSITAGPVINTSGASNGIFTGLSAGNYTFKVIDANGCMTTKNETITPPTALSFGTPSVLGTSCNAGSNGKITIAASGGTGTKTYSISPNVGTQTSSSVFDGLTAQGYVITVTDANGCMLASSTITVGQPTPLLAGLSAVGTFNGFNIACNGASTGQAQATAFGGTSPYSYAFNAEALPGNNNPVRNNLSAGSSTVTITDANGCTNTAVVVLTQPAAALQVFAGINNAIQCSPGQGPSNTGELGATASNGVPGYMYQLSDNSGILVAYQSSGTFSGLVAGTYTITARDANSCTAIVQKTLINPDPLSVTAEVNNVGVSDNQACSGTQFTLNASSSTMTTFSSYSWTTTSITGWTTATNVITPSGQSVNGTITQNPNVNATLNPNNAANTTTVVTYLLTASLSGCSTTASTAVTVNPIPYFTNYTTPDPTCPDAGAFGIAFVGNPNGADKIDVIAGSGTGLGGTSIMPSYNSTPNTNIVFSTSPIGIIIPNSVLVGNYGFRYRLTNSTTGCTSHSTFDATNGFPIAVNINPRPNVFSLTIDGAPNELCDATPTKLLRIQSTGASAGLPRQVLIERDVNGVKTTFTVTTTSNNHTHAISLAGIYKVLGVVDVNSCAGTFTAGAATSTTLNDARIVITQRITDTTITVPTGCLPTLTAAAAFVSLPSVGTINYQWQFDSGMGYQDILGANSTSYTLTSLNDGWKYKLKVTTTGTSCSNPPKYSGEYTISVGAITANAGADQTLSIPTFVMAATATGGSGLWTVVSSGNATIANVNSPTTSVTLPTRGSVTLRWTVSNGFGCSTFDEVTLTRQTSQLFLTAFLQGPLSPAAPPTQPFPIMYDSLRVRGYIPLSSPYPNCPGTIAPSVLAVTGPNAIVDWVKIVLHGPFPNRAARVDSVAALIQRDGKIVGLDGTSGVDFSIGGSSYYVSVDHRNHLAVMTNRALSLTLSALPGIGTEQFDFTDIVDPSNTTFGTPQVVVTGFRAMWGGDVNGDGTLLYNGGDNDRALIITVLGGFFNASLPGYRNEDTTMDGVVKYNGAGSDRAVIISNLGGNFNGSKPQGF
jgi:hypothetical protein